METSASHYHYPHVYRPIPSSVPFIPDLRTIPYFPFLNETTTPLDLSLKTPLNTPDILNLKRKLEASPGLNEADSPEAKKLQFSQQFFDDLKQSISKAQSTPKQNDAPSSDLGEKPKKSPPKIIAAKKSKAVRRLTFDEDKSSPVSGTIIRELEDDETLVVRKGDIDPAFNVVEITDEAKALIAAIDNKLGSYICRLCRSLYEDAFALAQHRCSRIVHIEYRCPECDKVFNCPANLASHRRWHKPRPANVAKTPKKVDSIKEQPESETRYTCKLCGKTFRRQAYLKKHILAHDNNNPEVEMRQEDLSAFKEVRTNFRGYDNEIMRDRNHNNYWDAVHKSLPYYESSGSPPKPPSIHSEDSRDLDITGSEDENEDDSRWRSSDDNVN